MKKTGFDEIFYFAEKEYGIGWNAANEVFFRSALTYGSYDEYNVDETIAYCNISLEEGKTIENITKEEILAASERDQGYLIIGKYMLAKGLKEIFIDSK